MKNTNKKGFTLIELIVVIAIISLLALGVTNYSFSAISDRQTLEAFVNKVVAQIETTRTNALVGKGVGKTFTVPDYWEMSFSNTGTLTAYFPKETGSETTLSNPTGITIKEIICNSNNTALNLKNKIGKIIFTGSKYALGPNCLTSYNLIKITFTYKGIDETIQFNTINGLIERID